METEKQEELVKYLIEYAEYIKSKYRPAMDHFSSEAFSSSAKQFVFELQAVFALDEQAREEGHKDAADKKLKEIQAERAAKAKADAEEKVRQMAIEAEAKAEREKIAAEQNAKDLQEALDNAKKVAEEKAANLANAQAAKLAETL